MIGSKLGHYEILRQIGKGGMGEVYAAHDGKLNREVALKVLPSELADDPDRLERFEREAKTVAALNHPNIVTIYSVEEAGGVRFMTMELVRGKTLDELIPKDGMSVTRFLELAVQLADAISTAHRKGIQHRDLKPANVMVDDDGRVKVLDFGLAKVRRPDAGPDGMTQMMTGQLTGEGKILGTVAYMSPEQAEGRSQDHRSDIFSFGILMYEMITGRRPFEGDTNLSILSSILKDEPDSVSDVRAAIPIPIARLIQRTLAKKPELRFQSAGDLKQDLATIKKDLETGEAIQSGMYSDIHSIAAPSSPWFRRPVPIALGAVALVAVLVAILPWLSGRRPPRGAPPVLPASAEARPSVAVFYFDNISGDEELEWLRTGLTDMLVTDLSQAPHLRVLATDRLYSMLSDMGRLDDRTTSSDVVREVGREAGMRTAVVGSFARAGDQLRINARVQDARTAEVLQSRSVSGTVDEIFALVDELSEWVKSTFDVSAEDVEMTAEMVAAGMGDRNLEEVTTKSVEAFRLFAQADRLIKGSRADAAIPLLERSLELDPGFAMALAKLSVAHGNQANAELARDYARRAFERADRLPARERHYIRGRYFSMNPETMRESIQEYSRAVELFPDHMAARHNLASQLMGLERVEEAVGHLEHLRTLRTPVAASYGALARGYLMQGRYDDAVETMSEFVSGTPESTAGRRQLAEMLVRAGRIDEALAELDTADSLHASSDNLAARWGALAVAERWDEAKDSSRRLVSKPDDLPAVAAGRRLQYLEALYDGRLSAARAVTDTALESLEPDSTFWLSVVLARAQLAQSLRDAQGVLENARLLRESGEPSFLQSAVIFEAVGHTMLGNGDAAAAAVAQFDGLLEPLPIPERVKNRVDAQIAGILAWVRGDHTTSARLLLQALELMANPDLDSATSEIRFALGESLWELGDKDQAAKQFGDLVESRLARVSDPVQWLRAMHYLGRYHAQRGERDEAERYFRRFLEYWGEGEMDPERVQEARSYLKLSA